MSPVSLTFVESLVGAHGAGTTYDRGYAAGIKVGRTIHLRWTVEVPDVEAFLAATHSEALIREGRVDWGGDDGEEEIVRRQGRVRLSRDGTVPGLSKMLFAFSSWSEAGEAVQVRGRRRFGTGNPLDAEIRLSLEGGRRVHRGRLFSPPTTFERSLEDVSCKDPALRARFLAAVRDPRPPPSADGQDPRQLVSKLIRAIHSQEDPEAHPSAPTADQLVEHYLEVLRRVPDWRRATILDYIAANEAMLGVRLFAGIVKLAISKPLSPHANIDGLDAAHSLYQFLYYTLAQTREVIGYRAHRVVGPRLRGVATTSVATLTGTEPQRTRSGRPLPGVRSPARTDDIEADFVIVGSGPAGSLLAERLSADGHEVLLLERGLAIPEGLPLFQKDPEFEGYTRLYAEAGLQAANDDWGPVNRAHGSVFILQGSCVGGGALVNNSITVPLTFERMQAWRKLGFPYRLVTEADRERRPLADAYKDLTAELRLKPTSKALAAGAQLNPAYRHLGSWSGSPGTPDVASTLPGGLNEMLLAKEDCRGCGYCNVSCPYGAKVSSYEAYLRPALRRPNVRLLAGADVEEVHLQRAGGRVGRRVDFLEVAVRQDALGPARRVRVRARKEVLLCAGAIGSSVVLKRSPDLRALDEKLFKRIGTDFTTNLAVPVLAVYDEPVQPSGGNGLQMTHYYLPTRDPGGWVVETWFSEPGGYSLAVPGFFERHRGLMKEYRNTLVSVVIVGSDRRLGSVHWYDPKGRNDERLAKYALPGRHARPFVLMELRQEGRGGGLAEPAQQLQDAFGAGLASLSRQMLQGGRGRAPREVVVASRHGWTLRSEADIGFHFGTGSGLWTGVYNDIRRLRLTTAHPQGGNPMREGSEGVVDPLFRLAGVEGLRICDASIFPDTAGVNPQWTILALAGICAEKLREQYGSG